MRRFIDPDRNSFLETLLKLIPSEVIAAHVFIQGVMPWTFWPTLVVSLLLVWIHALAQGPFRFIRSPWWEPWYGPVLLRVP